MITHSHFQQKENKKLFSFILIKAISSIKINLPLNICARMGDDEMGIDKLTFHKFLFKYSLNGT